MRDGSPPRNRPGQAAVFGPAPPRSTKNGKQERQTASWTKKNAYFVFKLLIVNNIINILIYVYI